MTTAAKKTTVYRVIDAAGNEVSPHRSKKLATTVALQIGGWVAKYSAW